MIFRLLPVASASLMLVVAPAQAAAIANWKELNGGASPATSGMNTDSPTIGDGTNANAQSSWLAGRFGTVGSPASVTLSVGQTLTVTGSYVLTGATNTATEHRFGIFNDGGQFALDDPNNWTGGWLHQPASDLYQGRTNGVFVSSNSNAVALSATKSSTGTFDGDSVAAFTFTMSITRDSATTIDIVSTLVGGDGGYDQTYTKNNVTTSLFTYTAAGLLIGGNSSADQVAYSGMSYSVIPEPTSSALVGLGGLMLLLRRRRSA